MFVLRSGSAKIEFFPKTASTAIANGAIVSLSSGQLIPGTSSTASHEGISLRKIASTDADYAATTLIPVMIPSQDAIFEADCTGLTAAKVGTTVDLTDSVTVNAAADSHHAVLCVGYISATKGLFKINSTKGYAVGA